MIFRDPLVRYIGLLVLVWLHAQWCAVCYHLALFHHLFRQLFVGQVAFTFVAAHYLNVHSQLLQRELHRPCRSARSQYQCRRPIILHFAFCILIHFAFCILHCLVRPYPVGVISASFIHYVHAADLPCRLVYLVQIRHDRLFVRRGNVQPVQPVKQWHNILHRIQFMNSVVCLHAFRCKPLLEVFLRHRVP